MSESESQTGARGTPAPAGTPAEAQLAPAVLMIRPARFMSNPQTLTSNAFQTVPDLAPAELQARALAEFDGVVTALENAGVRTCVFPDTNEPHTPDAIFPNNWVSFHADGRVVLYPMEAENRRTERRTDIVERLEREHGFHVSEIVDLAWHEQDGNFLEGTGSLVLDRANRIAYACLSSRTQLDALGDFAQRLDYDVVAFDAVDRHGLPIYHTNVLMMVGEKLAVVCAEAIPDARQRAAVLESLAASGHEVLTIGFDELEHFAGNMLELRGRGGRRVVAMSQQAYDALNEEQRERLRANGDVVTAAIDTIESSAGGSVRCMLAEIHLPGKA
ncbi:MAG TPA: arginine deiminase-related protein [Woeseiaceae bacterium]|nr:arginine deiminase-related protein [Woeseiaceae bacterium]